MPFRREWKNLTSVLATVCRGLIECVRAETGLNIELAVSWSRAGPSFANILSFKDMEDRSGGRR